MVHVLKMIQKISTLQYKLAFTIKTFFTAANIAIGMKNRQNTSHLLITKYAAQFSSAMTAKERNKPEIEKKIKNPQCCSEFQNSGKLMWLERSQYS